MQNCTKLTVQELKHSELQLLKWSQQYIVVPFLNMKLIAKTDKEGLIRDHGCLENARLSLLKDIRNEIVLPRDYQLPILFLHHLHQKRGHWGYKALCTEQGKRFGLLASGKWLGLL